MLFRSFGNEINTDVPATDHVIYERGVRVRRGPGTQVLARVVEPYFERAWDQFCSHGQTPNQLQASRYPAAVRKGNVVTILYPIFKAYANVLKARDKGAIEVKSKALADASAGLAQKVYEEAQSAEGAASSGAPSGRRRSAAAPAPTTSSSSCRSVTTTATRPSATPSTR